MPSFPEVQAQPKNFVMVGTQGVVSAVDGTRRSVYAGTVPIYGRLPMLAIVKLLKGAYLEVHIGSIIGVIKGDARSLDNGLC